MVWRIKHNRLTSGELLSNDWRAVDFDGRPGGQNGGGGGGEMSLRFTEAPQLQ